MLGRWHVIGPLSLLAVVAACSGSSKPAPTAPSTTTSSAPSAAIDLSTLTPNGTPGAGTQVPVVGIVAQVSGACPDLTIVLSGVTIHLSSRTRFESGGCSDIKEGMRAGAIGAKRADGSVDAQRAKIGAPPPKVPPPPPSVSGEVASLSGACPDLTFVIGRTTVHVSGRTVFDGGSCATVKVGIKAGATGPKRSDGSIDAERVRLATR